MLSRFHLIPERYGQTDRQTDGQICYINIVIMLTCDKNSNEEGKQFPELFVTRQFFYHFATWLRASTRYASDKSIGIFTYE